MSTQWLGDRAVLVTTDGPEAREAVVRTLLHHRSAIGVDASVRRGMRDVLVEVGEPDSRLLGRVEDALRAGAPTIESEATTTDHHIIEVRYDGADLAAAAEALGITSSELIAAHGDQGWRVAMLGFAPGFAYLEPVGSLVTDWTALGRRDSPRSRVPEGSVAIAAGMSAVYPRDMPGGWHLIGVSAIALFDERRTTAPSLLSAGDHVRFTEVGR